MPPLSTIRRSWRRWGRLLAPALVLMFVVAACSQSGDTSAGDLTTAATETADAHGVTDLSAGSNDAGGASAPESGSAPTETSAAAASTTETTAPSSVTTATSTTSTTSTSTTVTTVTSTTVDESTVEGSTSVDDPELGVETIVLRVRLDRRVDDEATQGFATLVQSVLTDDRGWARAGYQFEFDETNFDYTVVLAEGPEVDSLCLPYDTFGRFSCQVGPVVALNADRWRTAVDDWPATLDTYRAMLVNHEVGHLLGQHHPESRCPGDGLPAPVMAQQSSGVSPCTANPWPLPWEIACAKQRVEPLAPPYERDIVLTCGPDASGN